MQPFTIVHRVLQSQVKPSAVAKFAVVIASALSMSGCLLTSPFWDQEFSSHSNAIPLQAWTTNKNLSVKFECTAAYHGGLYPPFSTPTWTLVSNTMPSQNPSYDTLGNAIYSAGLKTTLPSSCWRQDPANSAWYASVRASQTSASGTTIYKVFDASGLACLGSAVGGARHWFNWAGCEKTYSNSSSAIPYVIFRAAS